MPDRAKPLSSVHRTKAPKPTAYRSGYTKAWQHASKRFLAEHPLCNHCSTDERPVAAECVDHIIPHRGNQQLFWDETNWQSLCTKCHGRKSRQERGGR